METNNIEKRKERNVNKLISFKYVKTKYLRFFPGGKREPERKAKERNDD